MSALMIDNVISDVRNCYNLCEGLGWVEQEPQTLRLAYYIAFRQPVPFLYGYQNGGKGVPQEFVEVFISGRGFPHHIAQVASRTNR